jgi:hypothetical protein
MTDFFADLERQLVDATPRRAQRLRRARVRRAAAVATVLLALVAGGSGLAVAVGGSDGGTSAGGRPAATPPAPTTERTVPSGFDATPRRGSYTVSVLNATTVPGLARGVANRLQNARFKIGNVTNAATQDRAQTHVFYATPSCRTAALDVARAIDVSPDAVVPATVAERAIAGDQAKVIVSVGSDQNTAPSG